ncbi:putative ion transporter [Scheffersomyces stipitis CBS 6054]|uniref:Putative ion transporter n=1 Tax=Scheffersomyces stipitis (strain ATCC 58785 / CBS 6054 / NBRC 10063 / NRRL Y-11545) TaxID=322104 RepID=A3M0G8_PICST|nr:putative ion transporter [Scheffersomyces stipitis CBS 6054]ABN68522.2 putative ion transporter [Scheffersomyces stipitis CBS 6054]
MTSTIDIEKTTTAKSLNYDFVPGTVHLVDVIGNLSVKKDDGGEDIILQPQPTSNINDPLRWSKGKKRFQFFLLWLWSFLLAVSLNFSGPLFVIWSVELKTTFFKLNVHMALGFLFLGLGCLFLQPTALKLSRRFIYLCCTIIAIVGNAVGSQATSINFLYVVKILVGLAAAPVDSLVEISSTDVFFLHERSRAFSLILLALYGGSNLGPVACGYIVQTLSWRWCFYIQIIILGVMFFILLFLLEDTSFRRDFDEGELENKILEQIKSNDSMAQRDKPQTEKGHKSGGIITNLNEVVDSSSDDVSLDNTIPPRTYWQRMQLIQTHYNDTRSWITIFYRPFLLASFPAIIWGSVLYGAQMMWLSFLGVTQAQIYSAPPYNFSPSSTGLTSVGAFVGNLIGMVYGGNFVDWMTLKMAKRNHGILEPEFRLYAMILPTICNAAGLLAYGLGSYYGAHWAISVVIGQVFLGFAMSAAGSICLTYAVDSYHNVASESLVLMLFIRNMIGMGFTFAIQPWLVSNGLKTVTWLMFMLSIVINGSFIFMIKYGKSMRRWTATRYEKYSDLNYGELFPRK